MTKSPASQLIEQVAQGQSPRRLISEASYKLGGVDDRLSKLRDKAVSQLRDITEVVDLIGREVTIRDIAKVANKLATDLMNLTDQLHKL